MDKALQLAIPTSRIALGSSGRLVDQFGNRLVVGSPKEASGIEMIDKTYWYAVFAESDIHCYVRWRLRWVDE